jgi:guanylate cyclase
LTYIAVGAPLAGAMPLAYVALSLVSTCVFGWLRGFALYRFTQLALILLLPWAMMLSLGGFHNSSAVILWSGLCPLGALVFCELRQAAVWLLAFLALTASSAILAPAAAVPLRRQ